VRVLLVHQPIDGGVARHVVDLFDGLTARGHEAILCGPGLPSASLLQRSIPPDAPHIALTMNRSIALLSDVRALRRFAAIVRGVRPDVIHAHSSKAGAIARVGKLLTGRIPVLYTPHGYAFAGFFEHEFERRAYREIERSLGWLTDGVVAVCDAEAKLAASIGAASRVHVVHNGIDPPAERPVDPRVAELARHGPVLCTVTQLRPGKGIETLIDALPDVLNEHPDAQIAIVGDGPLKDELLVRASERGVSSALHFLGEHPDPVAVLEGAALFVLSSWAESLPYVILEAMAVGLPIVSSDVGGIAEAVRDREAGLLVPARDAGATARAINELLGDDELRNRLAARAGEVVRRRFSRNEMVDGVATVYDRVLAGN
jgi:glycosyltransferase involved in cell wall biosynthesis